MLVPVNPLNQKHVMMDYVRNGPIGQTGVTVLQVVMVELNHELDNVRMEKRVIAEELL